MSFTLLVMPIITFIGVTGVVMLIGLVIMRKTNKVKVRMDRYLGDPKQAESVKRGEQKILKERRLKRRTTSTSNRRLETELEKAGLFLRSSEFILLSGFVSVLCITVGLVAQRGGLVFPFIFGVVGLCIPLIYIKILNPKTCSWNIARKLQSVSYSIGISIPLIDCRANKVNSTVRNINT